MERPAAITKLAAVLHENESRAAKVARLLHDEVGPTLSGIGFHLHALGLPPETLGPIREYLEQAMENVRHASNTLQSNVVERSGLQLALEMLVERVRSEHRAPVRLETLTPKRFPAPASHAIYRIVELAIENAVQHSGATDIQVRLQEGLVEVRDNGRGFDTVLVKLHPPGIGLVLMESYAVNTKLHLLIDSVAGQGTIVRTQTF